MVLAKCFFYFDLGKRNRGEFIHYHIYHDFSHLYYSCSRQPHDVINARYRWTAAADTALIDLAKFIANFEGNNHASFACCRQDAHTGSLGIRNWLLRLSNKRKRC